MRPTVSLCMIVKNEAHNLPQLLKSVEGCFDEIHITDTGSTDNTVEVAQSLGAKVHSFTWCDDFAAARNYSFSHAKTDYVMWLDGDDVLENREGFLDFRNNVMGLADYWTATYHYSSDKEGRPNCSFIRERVIKNNRGFRWNYFVHEGIVPSPEFGPVSMQYTGAWSVKHMRTEMDLSRDRSRNLKLFEKNKGRLDARMNYYYGKELFESGKPVEAAHQLMTALADPGVEIHDRILGYQYAAYAYMQCNQFERAIEVAHLGLQIAPTRAEYHVVIADCYMKLGRLAEALPFLSAAKNCLTPGISPIFHHHESYSDYPSNQIARIYANLGDFGRAAEEADKNYQKSKHPESKAILDEIRRIQTESLSYKNAVPCDDIVITCPPTGAYEWDHDLYKIRSMGGSETAAIEMATWLHRLSGRTVKIFNMRSSPKKFEGIEYYPAGETLGYMAKNKPWLHIAWRHSHKITEAPTYVWCHDLVTAGVENTANYEKVMALTPFHRKYLNLTQGVPFDKIYLTRNGLNPDRFKGDMPEKDPWKFIFSSSPDRGLDRTMRVLDIVRKKYPQVKLHIFYGIEHLEKYGLGDLQKKLKQMIDERKDWVIYHGATEQGKMIEEFKTSAYAVQPSDWIETSCISAMERTCCGVYQIMRAVGGVVDTLSVAVENKMAELINSDCITESQHQLYADYVMWAIEEEAYKRVKFDAEEVSWEKVALQWLKDLSPVEEIIKINATA